MSNKVNILFPVETINRELDFRLFLACMAVKPGNRIFVGQHDVLNYLSRSMNGGIYLGKSIFRHLFPSVNISNYLEFKKRQFKLVYLDEEGAVYPGGEDNWRRILMMRINPNYLSEDDYICTWGEYQADFFKEREPACKNNIRPTGHPRFDLYKNAFRDFYAEETEKIRNEHGDFILINSNLSMANGGLGLEDTFSSRLNFHPAEVESRTRFIKLWAHTKKVLVNFIELINRLSYEFPELKFIIRPHPSEDWSFYEKIFKGFDNVSVIHEGPVAAWLLACKMLIHDGCTTGIEAYLGGKPVITYKSIPNEENDIFIANEVGFKSFSEDEIVEQVKSVREGDFSINRSVALHPLVSKLMANFEHDSFESVLEVIAEAESGLYRENINFEWNEASFSSAHKARQFKDKAKSMIRPLFKEKQQTYLYHFNKFYGFDLSSIKSKMNLIQNIIKKEIDYKLLGKDLIIIETKNNKST